MMMYTQSYMPAPTYVPIDSCAQCGFPAPWNSLEPSMWCNMCDWTWIRRASGWNKSHKKFWYCGTCWPSTDADLASALESICPKCKHAVYKSTGIGIAGQLTPKVERTVTQADMERMKRASEQKIVEEGSRAMLSSMGVQRLAPPVRMRSRSVSRSYSSYSRSTRSSESSRSSRSRSRSRRKKKKKKKKKDKKKKKKSSRSDSSSSSSRSRKRQASPAASATRATGSGDSEAVKRAKTLVLNKLVELQKMESKEQRMKEFRTLLRSWHPDKNPDPTATEVFQFIQKGRSLLPN
mmetsp:Transcript_30629/g.56144  ORF Transcript_30629/g.56144 Transcript_30629/m.56144 type:complete len:293 (+) Transcript_30629:68-946(+)